jgi:hypothetical protein
MHSLRFTTTPLLAAALLFSAAGPYNAPVASQNDGKQAAHPNKSSGFAYVCPMHEDVKSSKAGKCPKCKMKLEKRRVKEPTVTPGQ